MRIGIIGGGPAGIFAALEASRKYSDVTLIDWNLNLGRKLASTGGGRGNLTNLFISPESYDANDKFAFREIIQEYDYKFINNYFNDLGIFTYHTDDGWSYPICNSAKNISEYLSSIVSSKHIKVINGTFIKSVIFNNGIFILKSDKDEIFTFDKIVVATGGKAFPQLRASDNLLENMKILGHATSPSFPALAPIETSKNKSAKLNGVRLNALVTIKTNNIFVGSEFGNIIFTEWGINGPGVMNLSHRTHIFEEQLKVDIKFNYKELEGLIDGNLLKYRSNQISLKYVLSPFFPAKLIDQIIANSNLSANIQMVELTEKDILKLINNMTIRENILGTRDFKFSQISTGSISSSHINVRTLESKVVPGLFFAGEILDVIGPCGGYNLHWAFVSGIVAGKFIQEDK